MPGQQSLTNCILFDLKFKVPVSLFYFLNLCGSECLKFSFSLFWLDSKAEDSMIHSFKNSQPYVKRDRISCEHNCLYWMSPVSQTVFRSSLNWMCENTVDPDDDEDIDIEL